ncbi:MAG: non-ribosomal peptide synthetase, partial [Tumebacillaceae bacterium]
FVNMLVMRTDFTGDLTFRDLLRRVRDVSLAGFAHQDVPFDRLVEELQPQRDPSYSPLFQVMFALQNATHAFELNGLDMQREDIRLSVSRYDLSLSMEEVPGGLSLFWEYNSDLFDSTTIERMSSHFETLLRAIAVQPDEKVWALPILHDAERDLLLTSEEISNRATTLVPAALETQAARTPDRIAIVSGDEKLTYRELHERANQVAHYLRKQGAGPETLVGISLERSLLLPIVVLGVMKAGAAFVPLDPSYPSERLAVMIEDAQIPLIVSQQRVAHVLLAHEATVIDLEADWEHILQEPSTPPDHQVQPHDLVYMIYTSGSTGRPKAVMIEHGNLAHSLNHFIEQFGFTEDDVMSCVSSEAFDVFYLELLNPMLCGGTVVLFTREQVLDISHFIQDLAPCTKSFWVPGLARRIAKTMREEQLQGHLAQLREIYLGGDVVTPDLLEDLMELLPRVTLEIAYGPTETTILCTRHTVVRGEPNDRPVIGISLGNADLRVYDAHQQLVPIGVPGELYVGGAAVARGYFGREELTAKTFLTFDNKRWYRTGDLVSKRADGVLQFHGRIDNQVKIRGYRIELGEVEKALEQHPAVQGGIVIAREDVPGDKQLVAYVVPVAGQEVTARDVQQFLKERLPHFMVPTAVIHLEALPLNANQKIDRKALPAPAAYEVVRQDEFVGPRTPIEEQMATIWEQTLAVKQVSVHDNFFELGGHSLLATQIISRIAEVFGVKVPVRAFFEAMTLEGLAKFVQQALPEEADVTEAPPIRPVSREGLLRTSFAQQRLWFADQMETNNAMYHMHEAVRLTGQLDREALLQSVNEIVRRHEALRTTFAEVNGVPMQAI